MPAEVIATVHQLVAACKKYKGIVFTDKDGNVINDDNDNDNDVNNETLEITGVDMNTNNNEPNNNTLEITGVLENNTLEDNTFEIDNTLEITGVPEEDTEETEMTTETVARNTDHNIAQNTNIAQNMNNEIDDAWHNQDTIMSNTMMIYPLKKKFPKTYT